MLYLRIQTRAGTIIYWNRLLNKWVDHIGNASPYTAQEIVAMQPLPFGMKTERL